MHRFFVPPDQFDRSSARVGGSQAHQIRRVLRLRAGERVILLNNRGWAFEAVLASYDQDEVRFQIERSWEATGEPETELTLYQAVLKGDSFTWVLQKGTEVGVSRFVPLICERNVVNRPGAIEQKQERWSRIIQEAAEQSGRARIPRLEPAQFFTDAIADTPEPTVTRLIPWEGEHTTSLREALQHCNFSGQTRIQVFVGPEGGLTDAEVQSAQWFGIRPVSLGPRILRAETAGVVAATAILYHAGDMG